MIARLIQRWRGPGPRGERAAAAYLKAHGYRILARNLRTRFGELDLLALSPDGMLVIIEVKARLMREGEADAVHRPELRVGREKQRRLVTLASQVARRHRLTDRPIRFDVVGVDLPPHGKPIIRHHPAAFESHV